MDVVISGKGVEIDSTLNAYIRHRIDFALSRFHALLLRSAAGVSKSVANYHYEKYHEA